ncbi:hypothetical protein RUM44_009804 [Polyplax serrata]|uniref:BtpA n=1 Tax=Polyplax serrata TaxID=468196 RepID=A0ABR1ATQ7_POLSC
MSQLKRFFQSSKPIIIGMIHVKALPGTPGFNSSVNSIAVQACKEAEIYAKCKIDSILIENMHDVPYVQSNLMGPEIVSSMTRICTEVRKMLPSHIKCGIQILAGANKEALAVAQAADLQFIRAEGYLYSHIADEGLMNSCAGELLRYRRNIGADDIYVFTDIKKKHCSHSITHDVSIEEMSKAAEFFLSDGVIVTGGATGCAADIEEFKKVKQSCKIPVLIGSGVTTDNVGQYLTADGLIIGSHFKKGGM